MMIKPPVDVNVKADGRKMMKIERTIGLHMSDRPDYRNGLARDNLDEAQFENALFQQLMRSSDLILRATDLAGKTAMDVNLKITDYQLLQYPPKFLGTDGNDILIRCYEGYPRFDFILGYTFIQVSVSPLADHDAGSAKIDNAFDDRTFPGGKNQIEEYLDAMFGGIHEAVIQRTQSQSGKTPT